MVIRYDEVIARVYPIHLTHLKQHQMDANIQTQLAGQWYTCRQDNYKPSNYPRPT